MAKRKRNKKKKKKQTFMLNFNSPKYRIEIEYFMNQTKKTNFKHFESMMDFYLRQHRLFLIYSSTITDLSTGEILHEYIDPHTTN